MIVADANLIAYAVIAGAFTDAAERVLLRDPGWAAPPLWRSEFASILLKYVRAGGMDVVAAEEHFRAAAELVTGELAVDHGEVLRIASASGASTYDAEYVWLARHLGVTLVSPDQRLVSRFPGVALTPEQFAPA